MFATTPQMFEKDMENSGQMIHFVRVSYLIDVVFKYYSTWIVKDYVPQI